MEVYVIRHAATEANEKQIINGQFDDLISDKGRSEIPSLIEKLKDYKFEAIYSSPLKRATQTALSIAEDHNVQINIDRRLIEVGMGDFTRKPFDATVEIYGMNSPELLNTYSYDLTKYGGESAQQVKERVNDFINYLKSQSYKRVLIVTHGGTLRWFYWICTNKKVKGFPNLSIHHFKLVK